MKSPPDAVSCRSSLSSSFGEASLSPERKLPEDGGPPAKRACSEAVTDICAGIAIFQGLPPQERVALFANFYELTFEPGETIVSQGVTGHNLYIIIEGSPYMCEQDANGVVQLKQRLNRGDTVGEASLLYCCQHTVSLWAPPDSRVTVWALSRHTFRTTVRYSASDRRKLLPEILNLIPQLENLSEFSRMRLADGFVSKHFEQGAAILRPGLEPRFHVIMKGQVKIVYRDGTHELLGRGSFFGEEVLSMVASRKTCDVNFIEALAYCASETWSIDQDCLRCILSESPSKAQMRVSDLKTSPRAIQRQDSPLEHSCLGMTPPIHAAHKAIKRPSSVPDLPSLHTSDKNRLKPSQTKAFGSSALGCSTKQSLSQASSRSATPVKDVVTSSSMPGVRSINLVSNMHTKQSEEGNSPPLRFKRSTSTLAKSMNFRSMGNLQETLHAKPTLLPNLQLSDVRFLKEVGLGLTCQAFLCKLPSRGNKLVVIKKMDKARLVKFKQVQNVIRERDLLCKFNSPFIIPCLGYFSDDYSLYLVLEYMSKGDLFACLQVNTKLPVAVARFYAAEILLAIEYIHQQGYIYRDLKPENILISENGHIKLADMGFCNELKEGDKKYTTCGTTDYMAPEILLCQGYDRSADLWAFGILIFEMLAGYAPFERDDERDMCELGPTTSKTRMFFQAYLPPGARLTEISACLKGNIVFPENFDEQAQNLVKSLCKATTTERLGMDPLRKTEDIKAHPFFAGLDWSAIAHMLVKPIQIKHKEIKIPTSSMKTSPSPKLPMPPEHQEIFEDF